MSKRALIFPLVLGLLSACDNDPAGGKPTAEVAAPVATNTADEPAADSAGKAFVFSNEGSEVNFVGAKVTGKHQGSFKTFSGSIHTPVDDPTKGKVKVEIDVASLEADEPKLTTHLKSPDLLDAAKFPKATFESTSIKAAEGGEATHEVTGNFTLHGETKGITFPATIKAADGAVEAVASFAIDRKQFGITYPGMPDDLIKDEVLIDLKVQAKPEAL